jgi:anion-transporting  ArsA/GET3 family ATPase
MASLLDLRFVFVVGKGGVGKTTAAAALALAARKRGKRVLLAMCNSKERLSHLLEVGAIGAQNQLVLGPMGGGTGSLDAVNMVPKVALEEYGLMVLRSRTLYRAVFENSMVSAVLRGTPGIEAWSMLGKAYFHTKDLLDDGRRRYDMVIVDAPATGHGLEMLRVPKVITDVAPPGLLRREAEEAVALFRDPARAGCMLVTLAEDMPVNETIELERTLRTELELPISQLVVNQVLPRLFPPAERDAVLTPRARDRARLCGAWARGGGAHPGSPRADPGGEPGPRSQRARVDPSHPIPHALLPRVPSRAGRVARGDARCIEPGERTGQVR